MTEVKYEMVPEVVDGQMTGRTLYFDASGNAVDAETVFPPKAGPVVVPEPVEDSIPGSVDGLTEAAPVEALPLSEEA